MSPTTSFLSNMVVVCVAAVLADTAFSKRMLHVQSPLGLETDDDTNFDSPGW